MDMFEPIQGALGEDLGFDLLGCWESSLILQHMNQIIYIVSGQSSLCSFLLWLELFSNSWFLTEKHIDKII